MNFIFSLLEKGFTYFFEIQGRGDIFSEVIGVIGGMVLLLLCSVFMIAVMGVLTLTIPVWIIPYLVYYYNKQG